MDAQNDSHKNDTKAKMRHSPLAGMQAITQVRKAHGATMQAKAKRDTLKKQLAEQTDILAHRQSIEQNYQQIAEAQGSEVQSATQASAEAQARIETLRGEQASFTAQLDELTSSNERMLSPVRSAANSAQGRADDAARTYAEAKKHFKVAEQKLSEASAQRDQQQASSKRTSDNAQRRIENLKSELAAAADEEARKQIQTTLNTEQSYLLRSEQEAAQNYERAQASVQAANEAVSNARSAMFSAEKDNDSARQTAERATRELTQKEAEASEAEKRLSDEIAKREQAIQQFSDEKDRCDERLRKAQELLDEANDIHATPVKTRELELQVQELSEQEQKQSHQLKQLIANEKQLRADTRTDRVLFALSIVAVIALIALLVWLLFFSPFAPLA